MIQMDSKPRKIGLSAAQILPAADALTSDMQLLASGLGEYHELIDTGPIGTYRDEMARLHVHFGHQLNRSRYTSCT